MAKELKRRDLSGIYIFDTFPGESHRRPTCIEDCQSETRRRLLLTKSTEWQRDCIMKLAETFKDLCNYLVTEHCVSDEQRTEFFKMVVEFVAIVNKVSYYVNVDNPEDVYTELEIARL